MKYKGKILLKATLKLNGNLADQNLAINLPSITGYKCFTASLTHQVKTV